LSNDISPEPAWLFPQPDAGTLGFVQDVSQPVGAVIKSLSRSAIAFSASLGSGVPPTLSSGPLAGEHRRP